MIKDYIQGNVLETEWLDHTDTSNIDTQQKELQNTNKDDIPDWDIYIKARLGSVGGQMSFQLIEYAKDVRLTDEEFNHPLMHQLERAVSEEIILVNDYLTFRKEVAEFDYKFSKMRCAFTILVKQGMCFKFN